MFEEIFVEDIYETFSVAQTYQFAPKPDNFATENFKFFMEIYLVDALSTCA